MSANPTWAMVRRDPVLFFASGFGSGLAPRAPGTAGTLVGATVWIVMFTHLPWVVQTGLVALAAVGGIWLCSAAVRRLGGVHDHPVIVWDEFAGVWIALWLVPSGWVGWTAAIILFRVLDIAKPWPIGLLDRRVQGGLGVMADDLLAGVVAGAVVALGMAATGLA